MNATLKRMFEDDDCSIEEAKLKAAILGKTYEECQLIWANEFKKELVLSDAIAVLKMSYSESDDGTRCRIDFTLLPMSTFDWDMLHILRKCSNVEIGECTTDNGMTYKLPEITVSFFSHEVNSRFLDKVNRRMEYHCL